MAIGKFRIFFLQVAGIGQQDFTEIRGRAGAIGRPSKPLLDEQREVAGVIEMSRTALIRWGSTGKRSQLRKRNALKPWNRPQSINNRWSAFSMRYFEPVTVPAPPRKDNRKLKVGLRGGVLVVPGISCVPADGSSTAD